MITIHRNMRYALLISLSLTTFELFALPFSITPKTGSPLPTQVPSGQSVTALYTVKNNTAATRAANYVKYLPTNVTQVTSDVSLPDLCGATFTLASGGSCTLKLSISGAVNAQDSNPHQHLFVCFP